MKADAAAKQVVAQLDAERNRLNLPMRTPRDRASMQTNLEQMLAWYLAAPAKQLNAGPTDGG